MTILHIKRLLACLLLLATFLTLCGCSASRAAQPDPHANYVVATAGDVEITYDRLYYIAMSRITELKRADENALTTPEQQEELKAFVYENLLARDHALLQLAKKYGLDINSGEIADAVQQSMDETIANPDVFNGDRDAYIESLNAEFLTDRIVREYYAVNEHLPAKLVQLMLIDGTIDDEDETATEWIDSDSFIRTIHVFIDKNNGKSDEENRANAALVQSMVAAATDADARYDAMRKQIGGKYNNDMSDTLGNGNYFGKGEMEEAYEKAAFGLKNLYDVSDVVETDEGYFVIMLMPKDQEYIKKNFQYLKEQTYYLRLNEMVDEIYAGMTLEMTDYGRSLDLMNLPAIDANGGETWNNLLWIGIIVGSVLVIGAASILIGYLIKSKKRKVKVRLLSPKAQKNIKKEVTGAASCSSKKEIK